MAGPYLGALPDEVKRRPGHRQRDPRGIWCYPARMGMGDFGPNLPWIVALAATAVAMVVLVLALARTSGGRRDAERKLAELSVTASALTQAQSEVLGRLDAMAGAAASLQAETTKTVNERLDSVSAQMRQSLDASSKHTSESLGELRKHLNKIDEAQRNITELSSQVVSLQDILANKQARGAFGEVQLNDIVRNILPPSAYELQCKLSTGVRPDCLIRLPQPPGPIAVDAKFPLEGYQAFRNAGSDTEKLQAVRRFRTDVKEHIRRIAERYIVPGETAESAMMFVPSEAVYAEIHAILTDAVEEGHRLRVWIVSPTTLWALLNTVRAVLKDVQMREQADVIQREVGVLLGDVTRLDERVEALEKHFGQAQDDVRKIRISTAKVLSRGERITDLQLEPDGGKDAPAEQLPFAHPPKESPAPAVLSGTLRPRSQA